VFEEVMLLCLSYSDRVNVCLVSQRFMGGPTLGRCVAIATCSFPN